MQTIQREWRPSGLEVYFSVNTGQNPWLLVREADLTLLETKLQELPGKPEYIVNHLSGGATLSDHHLF